MGGCHGEISNIVGSGPFIVKPPRPYKGTKDPAHRPFETVFMDRLHLTRRIKEEPVLQDLPVLIFSSMASDDDVHERMDIGAEKIITKPGLPNLLELLDKYALN